MTKQVNQFSLEGIMSTNVKATSDTKKEEPISEDITKLLSNVSKTIGIITWERKLALVKENPKDTFLILNSA